MYFFQFFYKLHHLTTFGEKAVQLRILVSFAFVFTHTRCRHLEI